MIITKAKYRDIAVAGKPEYKDIIATIDGMEMSVPLDTGNRHRIAIQEWVDEGDTIEEAE